MAWTDKYLIGGAPAGAVDGSSPENCFGKIDDFFDTNPGGGIRCLCYGGETTNTDPTIHSAGTGYSDTTQNMIQGCDASWTPGAAQYTLTMGTSHNWGILNSEQAYWAIKNINIGASAYDCFNWTGADYVIEHCKLTCARSGFNCNAAVGEFRNSIVVSGTGSGIVGTLAHSNIYFNLIYGFSGVGITAPSSNKVLWNMVRNNTTGNINVSSNSNLVAHNIVHQSGGYGIAVANLYNAIYANVITENTGDGIDGAGARNFEDYNFFRGNGAEVTGMKQGENDVSLSADPYVNESTNNLTLAGSGLTDANAISVALDWDAVTPVNYIKIPVSLFLLAASGGGAVPLLNKGLICA